MYEHHQPFVVGQLLKTWCSWLLLTMAGPVAAGQHPMGRFAAAHGLADGGSMLEAGPHFPVVLRGGELQHPPVGDGAIDRSLRALRESALAILGSAAGQVMPPARIDGPYAIELPVGSMAPTPFREGWPK